MLLYFHKALLTIVLIIGGLSQVNNAHKLIVFRIGNGSKVV